MTISVVKNLSVQLRQIVGGGIEAAGFIQSRAFVDTAWTREPSDPHHSRVRVLPHIKRLDDCFGDFLVRVVCECGTCREIQPQALARLVGWKVTLKELALRMRCSRCGKKAAEVVPVAKPRPRGGKSGASTL